MNGLTFGRRLHAAVMALCACAAAHRVPAGAETRETRALITLVMLKEAGAWKVAAFQNTQVTR